MPDSFDPEQSASGQGRGVIAGEIGSCEPCTSRDFVIDELEPLPEEPYRTAARIQLARLNVVLCYLVESHCREISVWAVAFALDVECAKRRTPAEIARCLEIRTCVLEAEIERARAVLS